LERENKVADAKKSKIRKPRVRKVPTLREQTELARSKAETEKKSGKMRSFFSRIGLFLRKTRITRNPITKFNTCGIHFCGHLWSDGFRCR
jgi:hypothetical protein